MGELIFIIIIICVVVSSNKKKAKRHQSVPNQPRRQQAVPNRNYQQRPAQNQSYQQRPVQNQSYQQRPAQNQNYRQPQTQNSYYQQQQTKQRLQQKYGSRNTGADDILSRAKNNVKENEQDLIDSAISQSMQNPLGTPGSQQAPVVKMKPEEACVQHNSWHADDIMEDSELMKQVNDLIVLG